jgi:hypothetical protein
LPNLPARLLSSDEQLLFGTTYIDQDSFFEQLASNSDSVIDSAVWNNFCSHVPMAAKAAALDELIANWDRHSRNMRYDGYKWWLFDHDNSLGQACDQDVPNMDATFRAHTNLVANQLLQRKPSTHTMPDAARLAAEKRQVLQGLSQRAAAWTHADPQVQALWLQTATLIDLLLRRLPMLQEMLGERIGTTTPPTLQWTETPKPPTNPT